MFERNEETKALHRLHYDRDDDHFVVMEDPSPLTVIELTTVSVRNLQREAEQMSLYLRLVHAGLDSPEVSEDEIDILMNHLANRAFHLSQQIERLSDALGIECEQIAAERKANEPKKPTPIGYEMVSAAVTAMTRPHVEASDEWRTLCERAIEDFNRITEAHPAEVQP